MSKAFKRKASAMAVVSRSRSRSVTPGPSGAAMAAKCRRGLLLDMAVSGPYRQPRDEEEPRVWKPPLPAIKVIRTPGGSLRAGEQVDVFRTPTGTLRRHIPEKKTLQQSIHVASTERASEMGLDQEEGEAAMANNFEHVKKWIDDLPQYIDSAHVCRTPSPPGPDIDVVPEVHSLAQPSSSTSVAVSEDVDVRPSTSGMAKTSRRPALVENVGSEFDSDFDDEFDLEEIAANAGASRDIPNDALLTDREINIINRVSRAMDDAADRLNPSSIDFTWQNNYDTFGGVPEEFSGPFPGPIIDYDTPYEAFTDIWSENFMEHIALETNKYARQTIEARVAAGTIKEKSRLHRWTDTNVDEINVFFAIYIYMGLLPRTSQHEYWKTTGRLETPKFRQIMSYNRYILLSKFIHFTDNSDVSQRLSHNEGVRYSAKLTKIAPVLKHLNSQFSKLYNLQQDIAIDESLTLFKGRLSWVQAIRTKAARFGIKSYELCESRTGYLWKFDIYTGKDSIRDDVVAPSIDLAGKSTLVVLDLLKGLENRGHLLTMDNFYNCPALARYLKSLGFDCLGTLRPNRKHVPVEIAKAPKKMPKGTIVALHSGDVSCIAWMDSKLVCMISTYHDSETFVGRKAGRDHVKPIAVRDYNNTMGGVDLKDQKLSMYLVERKRCVKWYMKIFKRLLNTSVLNAFIMLSESFKRRNKSVMTHRDFREQLADSLVEKHCHPSPQEIPVTDPEVLRLRRDLEHVPEKLARKDRGNCHICARNGTKKFTQIKCTACNELLCLGDCWRYWHYHQELTGNDLKTRMNRRRAR